MDLKCLMPPKSQSSCCFFFHSLFPHSCCRLFGQECQPVYTAQDEAGRTFSCAGPPTSRDRPGLLKSPSVPTTHSSNLVPPEKTPPAAFQGSTSAQTPLLSKSPPLCTNARREGDGKEGEGSPCIQFLTKHSSKTPTQPL